MSKLKRNLAEYTALPTNLQKIFFCGIGGVGMNPLAHILKAQGQNVCGSDCEMSDRISALRQKGIECFIGHTAENINQADAFVFSTAIDAQNPELLQAQSQGIIQVHRSDVLAHLVNAKKSVSVAGTHGKTTVSALTAIIFEEAKLDPTAVVGGYVPAFEGYFRIGKSEWIVVESDESDGSFQKLKSEIAVILNIDRDHLDHYDDLESIIKAFKVFVSKINHGGTLVFNADDKNSKWIYTEAKSDLKLIDCSLEKEAEFVAEDIVLEAWKSTFTVNQKGHKFAIELGVPGRHNVLNALQAIAAAITAGASIEALQRGCAKFHGVGRRFECLGSYKDALVIDDYAHHPSEIKATVEAAKAMGKNILTVFQPHRYSRTEKLMDEFVEVLAELDNLIITDIYAASEKQTEMTGGRLYQRLQRSKPDLKYVNDLERLPTIIAENVKPGDLILCLGAGSISKMAHKLVDLKK